jgi:hypothetical protein
MIVTGGSINMSVFTKISGLGRQLLFAAVVTPAIVVAGGAAQALELVVVQAQGVNLQAGQKIDGTKPLTLDAGQRLTLISPEGKTLRLRGPYNQAPAATAAADGAGVVDSLKGLVSAQRQGTATLGVVRAGTAEKELPGPWLVNVAKGGSRCILEGQQVVFWRPEAAPEATPFVISPSDRSWQASSRWPAQSDKMGIPSNMPLKDGQSFEFEMSGQTQTLTFHVIPSALTQDRIRGAWMMEKGCEDQAAALVKTIQ